MFYQKYKKAVLYTAVFITIAVIAASCSLKPVSAIQVIASPEVSLPLGSKTYSADKYLPFDSLTKGTQQDGGAAHDKEGRTYKYIPEGETRTRYLMHYPVETLDFDLAKNFDNTDLTQKIDTTISIPAINTTETREIAVNINDKLIGSFNSSAPWPQTDNISYAPENPTSIPLTVPLTFDGFATMTFEASSSMKITTLSNGLRYSIESATMKSNGKTWSGSISDKVVTFYFDSFNGDTITNAVDLILTVNITGGSGSLTVRPKFEGTIQKATGVRRDLEPISLDPQTVAIPMSDDFVSAEIGTGELKLSVQQPDEWTGITIKEKTAITQDGPGGLNIQKPSNFRDLGTPISMDGKNLNRNNLKYDTALDVSLVDATYTKTESLPVTFAVKIDEFSEVTLKKRPDFTKTNPSPVPETMSKWIEWIEVKETTVTIELDNGLPAGNNISIKLNSTDFKLDSMQSFPAGTHQREYASTATPSWTLNIEDIDKKGGFNLERTIIPGTDAGENYTLKNIVPGRDISFSGTVRFDLDWEKMQLKAQENKTSEFPAKDKPIDLSELTDMMKQGKLKLREAPVYFYVGCPLFDGNTMDAQLTLKADCSYTEPQPSALRVLVKTVGTLPLHQLPPDMFKNVDENKKEYSGTIPQSSIPIEKGKPGVEHTLSDVINTYPEGLRFSYTLNTKSLPISRTQYEAAKKEHGGTVQMTVDMLLDMPLHFDVIADDGLIPLKQVNESFEGSDLFGRKDASALDNLKDIMKSAKPSIITFQASFDNQLGASPVFILEALDKNGKTKIIKKEIKLDGKQPQELKFTKEEWDKILNTVPFSPKLYLQLEKGEHKIKKDAEVTATLSVVSKMDIDYTMQF